MVSPKLFIFGEGIMVMDKVIVKDVGYPIPVITVNRDYSNKNWIKRATDVIEHKELSAFAANAAKLSNFAIAYLADPDLGDVDTDDQFEMEYFKLIKDIEASGAIVSEESRYVEKVKNPEGLFDAAHRKVDIIINKSVVFKNYMMEE